MIPLTRDFPYSPQIETTLRLEGGMRGGGWRMTSSAGEPLRPVDFTLGPLRGRAYLLQSPTFHTFGRSPIVTDWPVRIVLDAEADVIELMAAFDPSIERLT